MLTALAAGTSVLAAQARGSGNEETLRAVIAASAQFSLVVGLALAALLGFAPGLLLDLLAAPVGAREEARRFLVLLAPAGPALVWSHLAGGVLRALKDTRGPLVIAVTVGALTTALNVAWIFGIDVGPFAIPPLGIAGAALAMTTSQIVGALLFTARLRAQTGLGWQDLGRWAPGWFRALAVLGVPITLDVLAWQAGQMVFTRIVAGLGEAAVAARAILEIFHAQGHVLAAGFSAATVTMVGQALGRGDFDAARRFARLGLRAATVAVIVTVAVLALIHPWLLDLFAVTPDVRTEALGLVVLFVLLHPWSVPNGVVPFVLRSGGDTTSIVAITGLTLVLVGLPLAWLLGPGLGGDVLGAYAGFAIHDALKGQIFLARLRQGYWQRKLV